LGDKGCLNRLGILSGEEMDQNGGALVFQEE
jgi:hypothetical protein